MKQDAWSRLCQFETYKDRIQSLLNDISSENFNEWDERDFNVIVSLTWDIVNLSDKANLHFEKIQNDLRLEEKAAC